MSIPNRDSGGSAHIFEKVHFHDEVKYEKGSVFTGHLQQCCNYPPKVGREYESSRMQKRFFCWG